MTKVVRRIPIGLKLSFLGLAFAFLVIAGLAGSLLRREESRVLQAVTTRAEAYARACREALIPQRDVFALHYATQDARKEAAVAEASVTDDKGRILSHTDSRRIGDVEPAAAGWSRADAPTTLSDGAGGFDIVAPIAASRRPLGAVRLRVTRRSLA